MTSLPPLSALRSFDAAARHGSFSKAAEELCVTHSAISHQIRQLEAWFGKALFEREARGVRLSECGEELRAVTGESFARLAEVCRRLKDAPTQAVLRVAAIPSFATRWLIPRLSDFTARHPELRLELLYAPTSQEPDFRDLDVVIRHLDGSYRGPHQAHRLMSGATRPLCSPDYLRRRGPFDSPAAIAAADLLHDESRKNWQNWCAAAGLSDVAVDKGPVFADFTLLSSAALAGQGIALSPTALLAEELKRGHLIALSEISSNDTRAYTLLHPQDAGEATRAFTDWLLGTLADKSASCHS